ncbi:MAG TPA: MarR family transcriptional regulator [Thermoanaerobaculia bacterium]|nr:MarR family transcriptional regulator [Thermoanaerobaculia bacterium]
MADRLHSAAIALLRTARKEDEASGLSAARLSALSVVVFGGPLPLGELARAEQVSAPTMTRIVSALEELGLVVRQADTQDRRIQRVVATEAGRKKLEEGRARRVEFLRTRLAELPAEELAQLEKAAEVLGRLFRKGR